MTKSPLVLALYRIEGGGGEVRGELSNPITTRSLENYCSPE